MSGVEKARERLTAACDRVTAGNRMSQGHGPVLQYVNVGISDLRLLLAEPAPEVTCPACGATIRARLADQPTTESVATSSTVVDPGGQP